MLVDPSPYDLILAGLTKALHSGQVLSRSNLKNFVQQVIGQKTKAEIF